MMNINRKYIGQRLEKLGIAPGIIDNYDEPHRYYHTLQHIISLLEYFEKEAMLDKDELFLAAVFHDIVYNPKASDNEEKSKNLFLEAYKGNEAIKTEVTQIITDTQTHQASTELSAIFQKADLAIFEQPFDKQVEYENQIFKEFQFADWKLYKTERVKVLEKFNTGGRLNPLIDYVNTRQPNIGVYAGSFNPFHKGHYNVLLKAEQIFDKVIIAFGKNLEKDNNQWPRPATVEYRQQESYSGLITDFIDSLGYEVTLIRGLRNFDDFHYEIKQYRYMQDLKPGIKLVSIFCDIEFEHISSTSIRILEKYNRHHPYLLE